MVRVPWLFLLHQVPYDAPPGRDATRCPSPDDYIPCAPPKRTTKARTAGREALWLLVYPSQVAISLPSRMEGIHGLMAQRGDETFIGTRMRYQDRTLGHFVTSGSSPRSSGDQRSLAKLEREWRM